MCGLWRFLASIKKQLSNGFLASIMMTRNVIPRAVQDHMLNTEIKKALELAVYKGGIKKLRILVVSIYTRFFMNRKETASNFI